MRNFLVAKRRLSYKEMENVLLIVEYEYGVDTKLYSATFAPMLNGRIFDTISGASSAVSGVEISTVRGEICVVVNYS